MFHAHLVTSSINVLSIVKKIEYHAVRPPTSLQESRFGQNETTRCAVFKLHKVPVSQQRI